MLAKTPPLPLRPPVVWLVPLKSTRRSVVEPLQMMDPFGELVTGSAVVTCWPQRPREVKVRVPEPILVKPV